MKVPISWLKEYVEIELSIEDLAHRLTMAGLEVEEILYVGLPLPGGRLEDRSSGHVRHETKVSGLAWDPDKIVVGAIHEVMPHPDADRLVLCRLDDGKQEHTVLTGAPNLFPYKGKGALEKPIKVAFALEGARIFDGHQPGQVEMTLKRARIRGVESYSMACSEKELGISDEHEGIIFLDEDAPVGVPLVEYMGDAVLNISLTPNMARNASIYGVAREVAALTGAALKPPKLEVLADGPPIANKAKIQILDPELNPRFVLGLIQDIEIRPSPYWVQRRLRLAGMRPINNIVDATNYVMLELGEPLHAFDYDVLVKRATGGVPTIITRTAEPGERLRTLDDIDRTLEDYTVLVCDTAGSLSIAGVMGGLESEVSAATRNILLEGAAWNFINIRRTTQALNLHSEASYRFSRGVHPAMAARGVLRGLEVMRQLAGGVVSQGLVDNYPLPPVAQAVTITAADARRWLGIELSLAEMAQILERLEFAVTIAEGALFATAPDHRLDIGEGVIGMADLMEEIARVYGYDRIPETRMADTLPPQRGNPDLDRDEHLRNLLVDLGLQEVITYRLTTPEREARLQPPAARSDDLPYTRLANPISSDRVVLRHSLLGSLLEIVEQNARWRSQMALFEIGPVFLTSEEGPLPEEIPHLVIALTGPRETLTWQETDASAPMDFYDLKGIVEGMLEGLKLQGARFEPTEHPSFHPGKRARLLLGDRQIGVLGELHPLVHRNYDLPGTPILAADLVLEPLYQAIPDRFEIKPVPAYPAVLEDLAIIVEETVPAAQVAGLIQQTGGRLLVSVNLFDVYRGEQIGAHKKSLAYSLAYQAEDRTLTDKEVLKIRLRIIRRLEQELGAKLRE
jgi:phenylalanyl-tRNA synthetase beta chain